MGSALCGYQGFDVRGACASGVSYGQPQLNPAQSRGPVPPVRMAPPLAAAAAAATAPGGPPSPVMTADDFPALGEGLGSKAQDRSRAQSVSGQVPGFQAVPVPFRVPSPPALEAQPGPQVGAQAQWGPPLRLLSQEAGASPVGSRASSVVGFGSQSWAEISSRPPSNAASPRGGEYRAPASAGPPAFSGGTGTGPPSFSSPPCSVSGHGEAARQLQVRQGASAASSQTGGAPSTVSSGAGGRQLLPWVGPPAVGEAAAAPEGGSYPGSSSPSSSIASAAPAHGTGSNGLGPRVLLSPPEMRQPRSLVHPPPATSTEYPPLPSSNRRSRGTSSGDGTGGGGGDGSRRGFQKLGPAPEGAEAGAGGRGEVTWQRPMGGFAAAESVSRPSGPRTSHVVAEHSNGGVPHLLEADGAGAGPGEGSHASQLPHSYRDKASAAMNLRLRNGAAVVQQYSRAAAQQSGEMAAAAAAAQAGLQAPLSSVSGAAQGAGDLSSLPQVAYDGTLGADISSRGSPLLEGASPVSGLPYGRRMSGSFGVASQQIPSRYPARPRVPEEEPLSPLSQQGDRLSAAQRSFALQEQEFPTLAAVTSPVKPRAR